MSTYHTKKYNGIIKKAQPSLPSKLSAVTSHRNTYTQSPIIFSVIAVVNMSAILSALACVVFLSDFVSGLCVLFFSDFVSDDTDSGEEAKDECSENCNGKHIHERHTGS